MNEDSASPLGEWLRQRREALDISLEQAEEDTRIRARYLKALEAEDFESLPGPVVGRGFLRNYASYLQLDPQQAADRYSELVAPPEPEGLSVEESSPFTEPFRPVPLHEMPRQRIGRGWFVGLAAIAVIGLAVLAWWGYPYIADWQAGWASSVESTATQRPTKATLPTTTYTPTAFATTATTATATPMQATPTFEVTFTPTFTPSPSPSPSTPVYTGIFLELVFTDTSWLQVTVDGVRQFQGEVDADTYRSWYGEERIELRIGNAGAVLVTVNGQSLGTLGGPGEVVDRVYEKADGQITEATTTPEITGTIETQPTLTPTIQPTAIPSTLQASPTVTITLTPTTTPTASTTPTATITPPAGP